MSQGGPADFSLLSHKNACSLSLSQRAVTRATWANGHEAVSTVLPAIVVVIMSSESYGLPRPKAGSHLTCCAVACRHREALKPALQFSEWYVIFWNPFPLIHKEGFITAPHKVIVRINEIMPAVYSVWWLTLGNHSTVTSTMTWDWMTVSQAVHETVPTFVHSHTGQIVS